MCCEQLLCAACAGPVVDARCHVCAAARARLHTVGPVRVPEWMAALAIVLVTVTLLLVTYAR